MGSHPTPLIFLILKTIKMKVSFNIENDEEFRQHIKDAINGQIRSIARQEIAKTVTDEVARVLPKTVSNWDFDNRFYEILNKAIDKMVTTHAASIGFNTEFISEVVNKKVEAALSGKDWNAIVDNIAKEKIKAMIG
jgi:Glu-tRNA(Gln) amidotransferase subunit E-like FAD-binding protein